MGLSPEERKRIYEEEKARLEAAERFERERRGPEDETSTGLAPNVQALLCYLGWWVTGLIFFFVEKKNNWCRFHAAQSIVFFGALTVVSIILGSIPFVGPFFSVVHHHHRDHLLVGPYGQGLPGRYLYDTSGRRGRREDGRSLRAAAGISASACSTRPAATAAATAGAPPPPPPAAAEPPPPHIAESDRDDQETSQEVSPGKT